KRSPPTDSAGIELPYISIPGICGIAPSTGVSRWRRYSSIVGTVRVFVIGKSVRISFLTHPRLAHRNEYLVVRETAFVNPEPRFWRFRADATRFESGPRLKGSYGDWAHRPHWSEQDPSLSAAG